MNRRTANRCARGFTLIEVMIALTLGLIVIAGVITVFLALGRVDSTALSQAGVQNADNTISAIVSPAIRGAGFGGCGTLKRNTISTISNPGPLVNNFNVAVQGYDAVGTPGTTSGTGTNKVLLAADNAADDTNTADWTPALDASLPIPEPGSDVLVVSGEMPGTAPASVNNILTGAGSFTLTDNPLSNVANTLTTEGLPAPAALSDCGKSVVFMVTAVAGAGAAVTVTHAAATPGNTTSAFQPTFAPGTQFVPLQQAVFYVAHGAGGQSALYEAVAIGGVWGAQPIVPGVENMQVRYGITTGGDYQWMPAGAVADWSAVGAVRIGFLIEGGLGSNRLNAQTTFDVLGTTVTVPLDTRLRHTFEMTVNLRNVSL